MSFKTEDESAKSPNQNEDNFGLPDIDYKPLDQLESQPADTNESSSSSTSYEPRDEPRAEETDYTTQDKPASSERVEYIPSDEPTSPKAPIVIGLLIAVVVCVAGFLVWRYVIQPMNEKTKKEELAKKEKALKAKEEQERIAREKEEAERKRLEAEATANAKPAEGTIEALTAPTKRYYVVVASAVDGDLVMDYAKKLSAKGVSSKIIPPFGKWKFNRISVGDYDSYAAAQSAADAIKSDYGNAVWVIRY